MYEAGPEDSGHFLYREQETAFGAGRLPLAGRCQSSCRHNAVQVGMQAEVLAPGM
ncbi:MAG: hypothetical protein WD426_11095 [Anditalea sp.]